MSTDTPQKSPQKQRKHEFYDWEKAKEIPILDVLAHFGIEVVYKSGKPWCRLRPEDKTPSTSIHVDATTRWKANTYHDFGTSESGDNISLTCKILGLDGSNDKDRFLGLVHLCKAFHIQPKDRDSNSPAEPSNKDYERIGLYGDLSTKNFDFNFQRRDIKDIQRISEKYAMPMNQLKTAHPRTFERLIQTIAIPYVQHQRSSYYMDLWFTRQYVREATGINLLESPALMEKFEDEAKSLKLMDEALNRVIAGTRLTPHKQREYAPAKILEQIDSGLMKPELGDKNYQQMQRLAAANQTTVKYRVLDLASTYYEGPAAFGQFPFSAYLNDGKAVVRYLEKDKEALRPVFEQLAPKDDRAHYKTRLNDKLKDAANRLNTQTSVDASAPTLGSER